MRPTRCGAGCRRTAQRGKNLCKKCEQNLRAGIVQSRPIPKEYRDILKRGD